MADLDPATFNARVEALTQALETSPDVDTRTRARDLVGLVLEFHRAGLERILDILGDDRHTITERLIADPLAASLLALHDLLPPAPTPLIQITRSSPASVPPAPEGHAAQREHYGVCERCGTPLPEDHRHVIDVETRRMSCSCRACWLLVGSHERSRRAVPNRFAQGPDLRLSQAQWDALQIPVEMAFFMFNTSIGRTIAFYPSPAGATESALPLDQWHRIVDANPWVRSAAADVEALLVRRNLDGDASYQCFLLPIDACYELVGRIRLHWTGCDGGDRVRAEIQRFFADVRSKSADTTVLAEVPR